MGMAVRTMQAGRTPAPGLARASTERVRAQERPVALPALTASRGLAALGVFLFHFGAVLHAVPGAAVVLRAGGYGPQWFFLLSGFVLTYAYVGPAGLRVSARRFWVGRARRILPAYLLALGLSVLALGGIGGGGQEPLWALALACVLLQAWIPQSARTWNHPGWSVSVEAFFYAVFGLAAARSVGGPLGRGRVPLWWVVVGGAWALGALVGTVAAGAADGWGNHPLVNLPLFALGVGLGRLYAAGLRVPGWSPLLAAVAVLGGFAALEREGGALPSAVQALVVVGWMPPWYALGLLGLAGGGRPARLLARAPLVWLGDLSYALYIYQYPCSVLAMGAVFGGLGPARWSLGGLLWFGGLLLALSWVSHRHVEPLVRRGAQALRTGGPCGARPRRLWLRLRPL